MNCPFCNAQIQSYNAICPCCGMPLIKTAPETPQTSQKAGATPQQNDQQQSGSASSSQGNCQQNGSAPQQGFQQQSGFGGYTQPNYGASAQGYAQPGYGTPMYAPQMGVPVSIPPGYCQKQLKQYQELGWFLGGIGLHDFYAGYMDKGFLHAVFTKVALFSFLLALFISEASDITIYEDSYSYYHSLHSEPASAAEIFCAIFLFSSFIIFVGNAIWAIIETVTVKKDSNGISMV